jgi:hypothetical protein
MAKKVLPVLVGPRIALTLGEGAPPIGLWVINAIWGEARGAESALRSKACFRLLWMSGKGTER